MSRGDADGARGDKGAPVPRLINLVRPAPLESLGSLLERLRVANHYHERGWLGGVLGRHPARPEVLRRVADVQTLGAMTGLDRATLIGLTLHRCAPWYGVDRRLGRPLPAGGCLPARAAVAGHRRGREHAGGGGSVPSVWGGAGGEPLAVVVAPPDGVPAAPHAVAPTVCAV